MPEVTRKRRNKTIFVIFTNRALIGRNHDAICKLQSSYKVHLNTISNRKLSDPLCDSVNKGLTIVRLLTSFGSSSLFKKGDGFFQGEMITKKAKIHWRNLKKDRLLNIWLKEFWGKWDSFVFFFFK